MHQKHCFLSVHISTPISSVQSFDVVFLVVYARYRYQLFNVKTLFSECIKTYRGEKEIFNLNSLKKQRDSVDHLASFLFEMDYKSAICPMDINIKNIQISLGYLSSSEILISLKKKKI